MDQWEKRESRNNHTYIWTAYFSTKVQKQFNGGKADFTTNTGEKLDNYRQEGEREKRRRALT